MYGYLIILYIDELHSKVKEVKLNIYQCYLLVCVPLQTKTI